MSYLTGLENTIQECIMETHTHTPKKQTNKKQKQKTPLTKAILRSKNPAGVNPSFDLKLYYKNL